MDDVAHKTLVEFLQPEEEKAKTTQKLLDRASHRQSVVSELASTGTLCQIFTLK